MHQGLKDLLSSERGTLCILLIIASTVLVLVGKLDAQTWITFVKWIGTILVASKTVTGAIETWTGSNTPEPAEAVTP